MGHFVYMLRCRDNSLYTGYTTNLEKRLKAHNSGKGAKYTRARRPVSLVFYREVEDRSTGLKLEYKIKRLTKAKKEELVRDFNK
ncbi:MAG: GIY-YIG nuclease family protein [Anaerococcus sp.]|nr:GIY-YIG nuclease family protein [Anaerococcus sp.]MDD7045038.1 GIY-YIG nuclease family protein [Peptoniphilaceae bacterium]MDY2918853.1 GIY-YIG nuclease family protein [Anaerococcus sp.]